MSLSRRGLITGLISLVAAPAIIRVNHLMPISVVDEYNWTKYHVLVDSRLPEYIFVSRETYHNYIRALRIPNAYLDSVLTTVDEPNLT